MTKGQFIRLFLSSDGTTTPAKVIAAAKSLTLHVSCTVEDTTTKDTSSEYVINEVTAINYDISTNALVESGEAITSQVTGQDLDALEDIYEAGTPVLWQIAYVSSANNRTKGNVIARGSALLQQLTINAANRQVATYDTQLVGVGDYETGNPPSQ